MQCHHQRGGTAAHEGGDIGSLEAGKYADLVAFDGDPLEDITVMTRPDLVMKGGVIYKREGQPVHFPLL